VYHARRIMAARLRIFVSSTMDDLANERALVVRKLDSFNFEPVNAEGILPNGTTSWERIAEELDSCHLCVLILGDRYGWVPKSGPLTALKLSVTHGEYRRARELGIPVLPFFKKLKYGAPRDPEDAKLRDAFREEVAEWTSGQFRAEFELALDLSEAVGSAVTGLLSDDFQRSLLKQRSEAAVPPAVPAPAPPDEPPLEIPPELRDAAERGDVVLFAGSGISLAAGLPSSGAIAASLMKDMGSYSAPTVGAGIASIAEDFEIFLDRDTLVRRIARLLELPTGAPVTDAHVAAVALFPRIITTNYDLLFERVVASERSGHEVLSNQRSAPESSRLPTDWSPLPPTFVLKLHGSYTDPESLIVSERDLLSFEQQCAGVLTSIRALFRNPRTRLLVVGSSLRDPTIRRLLESIASLVGKRRSLGFVILPHPDRLAEKRFEYMGLKLLVGSLDHVFASLKATLR
jgi:hypothetical protein